jgi:hypothetical protein
VIGALAAVLHDRRWAAPEPIVVDLPAANYAAPRAATADT